MRERRSARINLASEPLANRFHTAKTRSGHTALMYSIAEALLGNITCTCPAIRSVSAGAPPRYGTCTCRGNYAPGWGPKGRGAAGAGQRGLGRQAGGANRPGAWRAATPVEK